MATGKVKFFNETKGWGFVTPDDGSEDCFAHYSDIQTDEKFKKLEEGQAVEFEVVKTERGRKAQNIVAL